MAAASSSAAAGGDGASGAVTATAEHVAVCCDTLWNALEPAACAGAPSPLPFANERVNGLFVSWHLSAAGGAAAAAAAASSPADGGDEEALELRGCKGTFSVQRLHKAVPQYALVASLKDTRFSPISLAELKSGRLHCGVSLLHSFDEGRKDCFDWELGKHGIIIEFEHKGKTLSATFLPEVMPEQGWTQTEALTALSRKAGYRGKDAQREIFPRIRLTTYESSKAALHWSEYLAMREK